MKNEIELKPFNVNASPSPVAEGKNFLCFGNFISSSGRMIPSVAPIASPMRAVGWSAPTPFASSSATPRHTSAAGAGQRSVPSRSGVGIRMK